MPLQVFVQSLCRLSSVSRVSARSQPSTNSKKVEIRTLASPRSQPQLVRTKMGRKKNKNANKDEAEASPLLAGAADADLGMPRVRFSHRSLSV